MAKPQKEKSKKEKGKKKMTKTFVVLIIHPNGSYETEDIPMFENDRHPFYKLSDYIHRKFSLSSSSSPYGAPGNTFEIYYGSNTGAFSEVAHDIILGGRSSCAIFGDIVVCRYVDSKPVDCSWENFVDMYYYETRPLCVPMWLYKWWYPIGQKEE